MFRIWSSPTEHCGHMCVPCKFVTWLSLKERSSQSSVRSKWNWQLQLKELWNPPAEFEQSPGSCSVLANEWTWQSMGSWSFLLTAQLLYRQSLFLRSLLVWRDFLSCIREWIFLLNPHSFPLSICICYTSFAIWMFTLPTPLAILSVFYRHYFRYCLYF